MAVRACRDGTAGPSASRPLTRRQPLTQQRRRRARLVEQRLEEPVVALDRAGWHGPPMLKGYRARQAWLRSAMPRVNTACRQKAAMLA